jgi:hypothetical protein
MNFEETKEQITKDFEDSLLTLDVAREIDESLPVSYVSKKSIFLMAQNENELNEILHKIKKTVGPYELINYYLADNIRMAIWYRISQGAWSGEIGVYLNFTGSALLDRISGGKCKIKKIETKNKTIVCER